jgi:uncharacterized protein
MKLKIREIPEGYSVLLQKISLESIKGEIPELVDDVTISGDINRISDLFYIKMHFDGLMKQQCSRCLEEYNFPFEGNLNLTIKEESGKHGRAPEEDSVEFYYDPQEDELDISSAFYDEIMVAIPIKPLCNDDCKGIEVNDTDIVVESDTVKRVPIKKDENWVDPRWEALKKLKSK